METKILKSAAQDIKRLKAAIKYKNGESIVCDLRGCIKGKLEAASILTGKEYTWDSDGIYENHGNFPIIEA